MTVFKCPHCKGDISFDPSAGNWQCEYCGSELTLDEINAALGNGSEYYAREYVCSQCGAKLYSTDNTAATFCSYCGSSVVVQSGIIGEKRPDTIIPFKISKEKARELYEEKVKKTLLAPQWMRDEANVSKFRGIYMPFHVFRFRADGEYSGEASSYHLERSKGREYDVYRNYNIKAPIDVDYSFIPVDASAAFPDSMSRAVLPYLRGDRVSFDPAYYAGYYADTEDVDTSVYEKKYAAVIDRDIRNRNTVKCGSLDVKAADVLKDIEIEPKTSRAAFPVWFLSMRNRDRVNYAAVNGQTGEVVVDIPLDFKRYIGAALIVAAVLSLLLNLVFTVTPGRLLTVTSLTAIAVFIVANSLLNDTYRRTHHLDDAGYTGMDSDTIVAERKRPVIIRILFGIAATVLSFVLWVLLVILAVTVDFGVGFVIVAAPILLIAGCVSMISAFKGKIFRIRKKKATFGYKFPTLVKPVLAVLGNAFVNAAYHNNDDYCYIAGMFSILMIILTAFDTVRLQNDFTMRELPLFTEKRGGDE